MAKPNTTTTHTPGPWRVDDTYSEVSSITGADGFEVAEVDTTAILPGYREKVGVDHWAGAKGRAYIERSDAEVFANARLIAAAPRMHAFIAKLIEDTKYLHSTEVDEARAILRDVAGA